MHITNDGADIAASDYWESEAARAGKYFLSPNAGTVRLLVPASSLSEVQKMKRGCKYVILTRGRWYGQEAIEILFEDGSNSPYAIHLTEQSAALLPGDPGDEGWRLAIWGPGPERIGEFPARWRRVENLPYLKPWSDLPQS